METKATLRYLRVAPRKVRQVADLVRGKSVLDALAMLEFTSKRGSDPVRKLLVNAIASLENTLQVKKDAFHVHSIIVHEGPKYKRWMPRARGQASPLQKKTSHVVLVLSAPDEKVEKIGKSSETIPKKEVKEKEKARGEDTKDTKEKNIPTHRQQDRMEEAKPNIEAPAHKKIFRRKSV